MKRQPSNSIHCASVGSFSQGTRLRRNALFLGIAASVAVAQPTFGQPAAGSQASGHRNIIQEVLTHET